MHISITGPALEQAAACTPILRALPAWFGIEQAIAHYESEISRLPTWVASDAARAIGFVSLKEHTPYAAEVYVMGVLPEHHHQGVGRSLLLHAQSWLRGRGIEYLQVKTLGPSHPDEGYARTRAFYTAMGFRPIEEIPQIWGEENPCLVLIKRI